MFEKVDKMFRLFCFHSKNTILNGLFERKHVSHYQSNWLKQVVTKQLKPLR